ncbi:MAG: proteasome assembly chaperone family protein [Nanoarchaeota archaeon]|nr:proteasome assembly chaperone family protein [Nanoarchaeota archaeon]
MKIELTEKPKNPTIIEGFPGFGLVGTIATEFLIKHLGAKRIGKIWSEELLPIAAVHESKIVEPLGIFYDRKHNLLIIHALSAVRGLEWKISNSILELANMLKAKEIISLEAVGTEDKNSAKSFYFTTKSSKKKTFENLGVLPLKEGMVMGVTGALLLKKSDIISALFVESHINIGDSKAAAKVVEILDKYLGLDVDFKPLLKAAEKFESTLKEIMEKGQKAATQKRRKELSYLG